MAFTPEMREIAERIRMYLTISRVAKEYQCEQPPNSLVADLKKLIELAGRKVPDSEGERIELFVELSYHQRIKPKLNECKNKQKKCGHRVPCYNLFCTCKVDGMTYAVMHCRCEHERRKRNLALWGDANFW